MRIMRTTQGLFNLDHLEMVIPSPAGHVTLYFPSGVSRTLEGNEGRVVYAFLSMQSVLDTHDKAKLSDFVGGQSIFYSRPPETLNDEGETDET